MLRHKNFHDTHLIEDTFRRVFGVWIEMNLARQAISTDIWFLDLLGLKI
jgi:hypothetical protein